MSKIITNKEHLEKAKLVHKNKYDYSLAKFTKVSDKIKIICPKHGEFEQRVNNHIYGHGCPICNHKLGSNKKSEQFKKRFLIEANKLYNNKYIYDFENYKDANDKIKVTCPEHGDFYMTPFNHLRGHTCIYCAGAKNNTNIFIEKAKEIHGNEFDYSLVNYTGSHDKVIIICKKHGPFEQETNAHLQGAKCPHCSESKSERTIREFLIEKDINFIPEKRFKECKNKQQLPFDFYLPDYNLCIEYQGEHHYISISAWGGIEGLKQVKLRDNIKRKFCKNNNIKLLRFKYTEDLNKNLNKLMELIHGL
jgi:very-short-patch-repair endonuclease